MGFEESPEQLDVLARWESVQGGSGGGVELGWGLENAQLRRRKLGLWE